MCFLGSCRGSFLLFVQISLQVIPTPVSANTYFFAVLAHESLHVSGGIQFATAQLPLLELMDCGMTICDPNDHKQPDEGSPCDADRRPSKKLHHIYQKLIIKHDRLKKLSLWGCSGLDVRFFIQTCPFTFIAPSTALTYWLICRPCTWTAQNYVIWTSILVIICILVQSEVAQS